MMSQPRFAPFVVPDELRVVTAEPDLQLLAPVVASLLGDLLERPVVVGAPPSRSGDVVLTLGYLADPVAAAPEGFSVEVFADHVALSGNGLEGVARATARLVQLFEHDAQTGAWSLPPVRLDDAPLYPWRALEPTEALDPDAALRAIDLAFLASFNVVVLDGGAWPPERAAELEGAAFVRGIRVVRSDGTELPYDVTPFDDEGERPLRWTVGAEGDDLKLARRFAARAFVDATGGVPRLVSGPPSRACSTHSDTARSRRCCRRGPRPTARWSPRPFSAPMSRSTRASFAIRVICRRCCRTRPTRSGDAARRRSALTPSASGQVDTCVA